MEDLKPIAEGLDLNLCRHPTRELVRKQRQSEKWAPISLKDELSQADRAFIDSHQDIFPELEVIDLQPRLYPKDGMMAHVIGYTGEVSEAQLDSADFAKYKQGDIVGQFGIEREYNDMLMGQDGEQRVEVDNRMQKIRKEDEARHSRQGSAMTQHRPGPAGGRRTGDGWQERRRGGDRSAHRRGACDGQPAHVRPQ